MGAPHDHGKCAGYLLHDNPDCTRSPKRDWWSRRGALYFNKLAWRIRREPGEFTLEP